MFYRIRRILNNLSFGLHTEFLYSHLLDNIPDCIQPKGISIQKLDVQHIHWLQEIWNIDPKQMEQRLLEKHICYVSFMDHKAAGYHWVKRQGVHPIIPAGTNITIKSGEDWIYHVRVASKFQGQGISTYVYQTILNEAKELGQEKVYIYTSSQNASNQRSLEKIGFILERKFTSLKVNKRYYRLLSHSV